jgi:WD40 repeat protein
MFHIVIHDADSGKTIRQIAHAPYTMQLCFSPDGQYIASGLRGSLNKWLGVFDVVTGARVFDRAEHEKGITGLVFVDDGKCLLSTSADGAMKFWHVPSGTELLSMKMGSSIYQPSVTVDGATILWNQRTGPRYFSIQ